MALCVNFHNRSFWLAYASLPRRKLASRKYPVCAFFFVMCGLLPTTTPFSRNLRSTMAVIGKH